MSGMKFEKEIFMKYLIEREASEATKKKYMTDVTTFYSYAAEAEEIDKELLLAYREWLDFTPDYSAGAALCSKQCKFDACGTESVFTCRWAWKMEAPQSPCTGL